ncbi:MAG TPA: hypothetical protein VF494_05770 [Candidatus Limnocylindrales bacterium]
MAARLTARFARRVATAVVIIGVVALAAGCVAPRRAPTYPPADVTPPPTAGRTDAARAAVVQALTAAGLAAGDQQQPYAPPQGAWFAAAPRSVVQVSVPNEIAPRFIAIYAFDSPVDAATAGMDQAAYIAKGPGRLFFTGDTRFTIRVLGSVVIFFAWAPGTAEPRAADVQAALETIGTAVAIPA